MRVGTYMYPLIEDPLLAIGFFVYLSDAEMAAMDAPATATITGPATWNGDAPLEIQITTTELERGFVWYAPNTAVTGTYEVELDTGTSTHTSTASLDSRSRARLSCQAVAHSAESRLACSRTVWVAFSCMSGG